MRLVRGEGEEARGGVVPAATAAPAACGAAPLADRVRPPPQSPFTPPPDLFAGVVGMAATKAALLAALFSECTGTWGC